MEKKKKKQPKTLTLVLSIIAFVSVSSFVFLWFGGSFSGQTNLYMSDEEKLVFFESEGKTYTVDIQGKMAEAERKADVKLETEGSLFFGKGNNYNITYNSEGIYFLKKDGELYKFEIDNMDISSIKISADEKCFIAIANKRLFIINLKDDEPSSYTPVDDDVDFACFTGGLSDIAYLKGTELYYSSGGYKAKIDENVNVIETAHDSMAVFYLKEGSILKFEVGSKNKEKNQSYDTSVSDIFYMGKGTLAYIKDNELYLLVDGKPKNLHIKANSIIKAGE